MSADGKTKPLVQWALMIDAGSTGSRVHVYKFNNCQKSPTFEYEVFKQTRPGLSKFAKDPESAAKSLDSLMQEAERVVPQNLWKCSPVAVKATAGLRLLGHSESEAILEAVRHRLETKYHFAVVQKDGVVIMDGKDEGVYAWITANYLLDTLPLQPPKTAADRLSNVPYAVLDLGGASTQIVFKPSFDIDGDGIDDTQGLEEGEHKYDLHFAGQTHELYQHSYLGYGLMRARASVHRLVEFMASYSTTKSPAHNKGLGMTRTIEVDIGRDGNSIMKNVTMHGGDIGSWSACNRVLELVLAKDAVCHLKPCSFNGVYQPSLLDSFPTGPILLLSYFYDRLAPLLTPIPKALPGKKAVDPTEELSFPISMIKDIARAVCEGETTWARHQFPFASPDRDAPTKWGESEELMEELKGRPEYCLDLSFMYALLRLGYEFGEKRHVRIGKQ
ncbi:7916_t:CDS:2, partial [Acaulospora colombiana]